MKLSRKERVMIAAALEEMAEQIRYNLNRTEMYDDDPKLARKMLRDAAKAVRLAQRITNGRRQ